MSTLIAKAIAPGATIGIVAPASPYDQMSDVERGVAWWESRNYKVKFAEGALHRTNYVAGTPESRASDVMATFADAEVDAIQCLRGGYGSAETIPLIDFKVIADNPKPFIGFSDITALHTAIHRFTGLVTFYGPSLTSLASMSTFTEQRMLAMLGGETTGAFPSNPDDSYVQTLATGKASGRLIGGCLSDLMYTMGTPWELDLDGAIFVFEEVGSSPHTIDRALFQLAQAGKLKDVAGVVVGDLVACEWHDGGGSPWPHTKTLEEVLKDRLAPLGIPVIYRLPFGHGDHLATVPLGVQATVDAIDGSLVVTEPALHRA